MPDVIHETHMSRVVLRGDRAYKRLKPVDYAFADFSTLAKRRAACEAELAHNRPWAPGVYLAVLPVAGDPPEIGAPGEPVDWAVEMVRLPDRARLSDHLADGPADGDAALLERVGAHVRDVHDDRPARPGASAPDTVRARIVENLDELLALEVPLPAERIRAAVTGALERAGTALEARAGEGRVLHGDLRTEHVYVLEPVPGLHDGVVVLDGVAFNPSLAEGDPVEDTAFLAMELGALHGRHDLEEALWRGWRAGPGVTPELRDLYVGHRALIRAKVAALQGRPDRVLRHLLAALGRLEGPLDRPALVGVGGLPGVGKSALAALLEAHAGFGVLRTDVLRKAGANPPDYSPAGRDAVYTALFEIAAERLARGERVLVDASFERESWRAGFLDLAQRFGVRPILMFAHASESVVAERLARRALDPDEPSDADLEVHRQARTRWEAPARSRQAVCWVDTGVDLSQVFQTANTTLVGLGLSTPDLTPGEFRATGTPRRSP